MLTDKDLTLLLDLVNKHRKECAWLNVGARPHPYIQEADGIITELVAMRDNYRRSVAALRLESAREGAKMKKPITPQVPALAGMTPLGIKHRIEFLTPNHPHYEIVWGGLARLVGSLDGWQYLGPNPAYNAHVFRCRETPTSPRRVVMITADGKEAR